MINSGGGCTEGANVLESVRRTLSAASRDDALVDCGLVAVAISRAAVSALVTIILVTGARVHQRRPSVTQRLVQLCEHTHPQRSHATNNRNKCRRFYKQSTCTADVNGHFRRVAAAFALAYDPPHDSAG